MQACDEDQADETDTNLNASAISPIEIATPIQQEIKREDLVQSINGGSGSGTDIQATLRLLFGRGAQQLMNDG